MTSARDWAPTRAEPAASVGVRLFRDLDEVACDAGDALGRRAQPSLYDRLDWLRLTGKHVLPAVGLVVARAGGGEEGASLFLHDCGRRRARAFAGWYTLAHAPVFTPGLPPARRTALLSAMAAGLRGFDRIDLAPLTADVAAELRRAFEPEGCGGRSSGRRRPTGPRRSRAGVSMITGRGGHQSCATRFAAGARTAT